MQTLEYAPGRLADRYPGSGAGHVLLWHGREPNKRDVLTTLAGLVADRGPTMIVPDWSSETDDGGRSDLLRSLRFVREDIIEEDGLDPDALVLAGWSLGGAAAAGLTLHARRLGVGVAHTVCLAGGFPAPDPVTGRSLTDQLPTSRRPTSFTLLHGIADDIVPVNASRAFAQQLDQAGWPAEVFELPTDHGGIAAAELDPAGDRYRAATDDATLAVAAEVAARIAAVTSPPGTPPS